MSGLSGVNDVGQVKQANNVNPFGSVAENKIGTINMTNGADYNNKVRQHEAAVFVSNLAETGKVSTSDEGFAMWKQTYVNIALDE